MKNEVVFLSFEEAQVLVDRIADRCLNFNYTMSDPEKESMAQLLNDVGVKVSDLIDISNLADNYAINAEIVNPEEVGDYDKVDLNDCLFSWEDSNGKHYCLTW